MKRFASLLLTLLFIGQVSVCAAADSAEPDPHSAITAVDEKTLVVDMAVSSTPETAKGNVGGAVFDEEGHGSQVVGDVFIEVNFDELSDTATEQMKREFDTLSEITGKAAQELTLLHINSAIYSAPKDVRDELIQKASGQEIAGTLPTQIVSSVYPVRVWLPIDTDDPDSFLSVFLFDEHDNWYVPEGMEVQDLSALLEQAGLGEPEAGSSVTVVSFILDRPALFSLSYLSTSTSVETIDIPGGDTPLVPSARPVDSPERRPASAALDKTVADVTMISAITPEPGSVRADLVRKDGSEVAEQDGSSILVDVGELSDNATEQMAHDFDELGKTAKEAEKDLTPGHVTVFLSAAPENARESLLEKAVGSRLSITLPTRIVANVYPVKAWIPLDADSVGSFLTVFLRDDAGNWFVPRGLEVVELHEVLSEAALAELAEQQGLNLDEPLYVVRFLLDQPSHVSFVFLSDEAAP